MRCADQMHPVSRSFRAVRAVDEHHRRLRADRILEVQQTIERDAHAQDDLPPEGCPQCALGDAALV